MRIYLDHNATTRLDPRVRAAMNPVLSEAYGNPSSIHEEGRRARDAVERARAEVARLIGAASGQVIFTSGGTEADWLGVAGAARAARAAGRPARIVTSPLEHPAVRGAAAALAEEGFEVIWVGVDEAGRIAAEEVARALAPGAAVVSVALANHEIGNIYDIASFAALARAAGAVFHCDAVQAAGKLGIDVDGLGVDLQSLSAHKIHGPKGVGALWVRGGVELALPHAGGHQERGLRPGTENVIGIVGLGAAAALAREDLARAPALAERRDRLETGLVALGARVNGDRARRVPNTTNVAWEGAPGDLMVAALDLEGIAVATGAACTSGSLEPSPVILALGQPRARAAEAVRFSLGKGTTDEEIDRVLAILPALLARVRANA